MRIKKRIYLLMEKLILKIKNNCRNISYLRPGHMREPRTPRGFQYSGVYPIRATEQCAYREKQRSQYRKAQ